MRLSLTPEEANRWIADARREIREAQTLQAAAQLSMDRFRADFAESIVLARTYATIPYRKLPASDRAFVDSLAARNGLTELVHEDARVLSLLGTAGIEFDWSDRYRSRSHLAIPLFSESVVESIPMVAALIRDLGKSASWFENRALVESGPEEFGVFTQSFFVGDPVSMRDHSDRLLIPAQDFVQTYGVKSVCGVGGEFLHSRMVVVCIFFSREELQQAPSWLLRLPLMLSSMTLPLVAAGKLYAE